MHQNNAEERKLKTLEQQLSSGKKLSLQSSGQTKENSPTAKNSVTNSATRIQGLKSVTNYMIQSDPDIKNSGTKNEKSMIPTAQFQQDQPNRLVQSKIFDQTLDTMDQTTHQDGLLSSQLLSNPANVGETPRQTVYVYDPENPKTPANNRTIINVSDSERSIPQGGTQIHTSFGNQNFDPRVQHIHQSFGTQQSTILSRHISNPVSTHSILSPPTTYVPQKINTVTQPYPLQGNSPTHAQVARKDIEIKINQDNANFLNPTVIGNKMYVENPEHTPSVIQTQVTTTLTNHPGAYATDYTQSPRATINDVSMAYLGSPSSRRVRVSETGHVGTTPGISRSPKRVIATDEIDSHARGYYPSLDKPITEKVTVYEGEGFVVGHVPAHYNTAYNTTVINPVVAHREYVQAYEPRQYISPQVEIHSPTVIQQPVYTEPIQYQVVADQYFPDGSPNLFRTFEAPVLTQYAQPQVVHYPQHVVSSPRLVTPTAVVSSPKVYAPQVISSPRVVAAPVISTERVVAPTVISSPRAVIEPSKIVKGDAYEIGRNFIGIGSPRSSYTVTDHSSPKTYLSSPTRARTADELIIEGYRPVAPTNQVVYDRPVVATPVVATTYHNPVSYAYAPHAPLETTVQYIQTTPSQPTYPNLFTIPQHSPVRAIQTNRVITEVAPSPSRTTTVYANPIVLRGSPEYVSNKVISSPTTKTTTVITQSPQQVLYEPTIEHKVTTTVTTNPFNTGTTLNYTTGSGQTYYHSAADQNTLKLYNLFENYDQGNTGYINESDLPSLINDAYSQFGIANSPSDSQIASWLSSSNREQIGFVSREEFLSYFRDTIGNRHVA